MQPFSHMYSDREWELVKTRLKKFSSKDWSRVGKRHVADLRKRMAARVPAYKKLVKKQDGIPILDKQGYLKTHSIRDLSWDGDMRIPSIFTASSGSTGTPTYFLRHHGVDQQAAIIHELFFNTACDRKKPTLVIVCFSMGVWIGGMITFRAFGKLAQRSYPITIITPGINMTEILRALKTIAPEYDQVILAGYPPFIKDVLDEAKRARIPINKLGMRLLFAAEAFTDRFRNHVSRIAGIRNPFLETMNIYGSADLGAMAFETPIACLVRSLAVKDKRLFRDIFGSIEKTPTLAQFIPTFTYFEERGGELFVSGDSTIPLVDYRIGDRGGVHAFSNLAEIARSHGIDIRKEARKAGIADTITELPFVYAYERIDMSVSLYGLQVYAEPVRDVLLRPAFKKRFSGKCVLHITFDKKQNQTLDIDIELAASARPDKKTQDELRSAIAKNLRAKNAEYNELSKVLADRALPRLAFWPRGHQKYFKQGVKQKWVL